MSEAEDRKGVLVPSFVVVIASGLITIGMGGLFAFIVDTREDVVRLETRVEGVQNNASSLREVPSQLSAMTEQIKQVQRELTGLRADLDEQRKTRR